MSRYVFQIQAASGRWMPPSRAHFATVTEAREAGHALANGRPVRVTVAR